MSTIRVDSYGSLPTKWEEQLENATKCRVILLVVLAIIVLGTITLGFIVFAHIAWAKWIAVSIGTLLSLKLFQGIIALGKFIREKRDAIDRAS